MATIKMILGPHAGDEMTVPLPTAQNLVDSGQAVYYHVETALSQQEVETPEKTRTGGRVKSPWRMTVAELEDECDKYDINLTEGSGSDGRPVRMDWIKALEAAREEHGVR